MTRKTKAQLIVEADNARKRDWQEFSSTYKNRLIELLFNWTRYPADFVVKKNAAENTFTFISREYSAKETLPVNLPEEYDSDIVWALDNAESVFEQFEAHQAALEENARRRRAAIEKLTPEERELLNL